MLGSRRTSSRGAPNIFGAVKAVLTGAPHSQETAPPLDSTFGPCLGPYGGLRGVGVSYERGTPVAVWAEKATPGFREWPIGPYGRRPART